MCLLRPQTPTEHEGQAHTNESTAAPAGLLRCTSRERTRHRLAWFLLLRGRPRSRRRRRRRRSSRYPPCGPAAALKASEASALRTRPTPGSVGQARGFFLGSCDVRGVSREALWDKEQRLWNAWVEPPDRASFRAADKALENECWEIQQELQQLSKRVPDSPAQVSSLSAGQTSRTPRLWFPPWREVLGGGTKCLRYQDGSRGTF